MCYLGRHWFNNRRLNIPAAGGLLFLRSEKFPVETGHNSFAEGCSEGVDYPENKKRKMNEYTRMVLRSIPAMSVFVGHGFLKHAFECFCGTS